MDSKISMIYEAVTKTVSDVFTCLLSTFAVILTKYCNIWSQISSFCVYLSWKWCFFPGYCGCRIHCLHPLAEYCGCSCTHCTHGSYAYAENYHTTRTGSVLTGTRDDTGQEPLLQLTTKITNANTSLRRIRSVATLQASVLEKKRA